MLQQLPITEIRARANAFSKKWEGETSEDAEAKSFWDDFFNVFGITRRRIASFELPVKKADGKGGFIDLLWKGVLLVEHKSRGKDLDTAYAQAKDYFAGLKERDLPRYVVVSDFERFRFYDLDEGEQHEFTLKSFSHYIHLFSFMTGRQVRAFSKQDPVNVKAVERLGILHDQMSKSGYNGKDLEVFLVRLLFCLFAEDNGIFEKNAFRELIESRTADDGTDLDGVLAKLFHVLNTPEEARLRNLPDDLAAFPYVNGRLYEAKLPPAQFDKDMLDSLLECMSLDWSKISPAVFGSLFQSVMDKKTRREGGSHYTTETNILKALQPLFLDSLRTELDSIKRSRPKLLEFQRKLANFKIMDPACGCGNFLVVAYRELRLIELDVLRALYAEAKGQKGAMLDVGSIVFVDVDQFYGIEINEWPAQIAQVAMWLIDHQMNMMVSEEFGQYFVRIPLRKAPNIVCDNALTRDWANVLSPADCSFIVGNPPFLGKKEQKPEQKADFALVMSKVKGAGVLDFVSAWYVKATEYMLAAPEGARPLCALVSTNSVTQGEQVAPLWGWLLERGVKIHFAHRTFRWSSEARKKAAVHCVIIGFGIGPPPPSAVIYEYDDPAGEPHAVAAKNINPYLVDFDDVLLIRRSKPLCFGAPMVWEGITPLDDGHLSFKESDYQAFIVREPAAKKWVRPWLTGNDYIYGTQSYCLWLADATPADLRAMPAVMERVAKVREFREKSKSSQGFANTPWLFRETSIPKEYYLIPKTSSENRRFFPIGPVKDVIATNSALYMENGDRYHFGIMLSTMHNAWVRYTCGRLESRIRYSAAIVYNNYPWPKPTDKQREAIEVCAQAVLDARASFPDSTIADLYDPLSMPLVLLKAHQRVGRDSCKSPQKQA